LSSKAEKEIGDLMKKIVYTIKCFTMMNIYIVDKKER